MKARIAGQTLGHSQSYIWKPTDQLKVIIGNAKMSVRLVVVAKCLPCTHRTLRPPHSPRVLDVEAREARPRRGDGVAPQKPG